RDRLCWRRAPSIRPAQRLRQPPADAGPDAGTHRIGWWPRAPPGSLALLPEPVDDARLGARDSPSTLEVATQAAVVIEPPARRVRDDDELRPIVTKPLQAFDRLRAVSRVMAGIDAGLELR